MKHWDPLQPKTPLFIRRAWYLALQDERDRYKQEAKNWEARFQERDQQATITFQENRELKKKLAEHQDYDLLKAELARANALNERYKTELTRLDEFMQHYNSRRSLADEQVFGTSEGQEKLLKEQIADQVAKLMQNPDFVKYQQAKVPNQAPQPKQDEDIFAPQPPKEQPKMTHISDNIAKVSNQ